MSTYTVMDIAEYLVTHYTSLQKPISNLKLQKLLYFVWVDYYKNTKNYLYTEELQAWPLGPVSPAVYHRFAAYGGMPISKKYQVCIDNKTKNLIDTALSKYGGCSAGRLVARTHRPNTPWSLIFRDGDGNRDTISFRTIIENEPALQVE